MTTSIAANKAQPIPVALFVSDLHLQPELPRTTQKFLEFLLQRAIHAQQLYLLGDLFEYWAGDDDLASPYNKKIVDALRQVSDAGVAIFWIAGNRDFLVGADLARAAGMTLLDDPTVVDIAGEKIVLTHGDQLCTDDTAYMAFRVEVRQAAWQQNFLAMPLTQRKTIIAGLRQESRNAQRGKSMEIMDANQDAIAALFNSSATAIMIHGHTHRPAKHEYSEGDGTRVRHVLTDWDCDATDARGGWIEITNNGAIRHMGIDGDELP